jgi:pilus assembly protein Flp/PilA
VKQSSDEPNLFVELTLTHPPHEDTLPARERYLKEEQRLGLLLILLVSVNGCYISHGEEGETYMKRLMKLALKLEAIVKDTRGQDLIEYALMAGFVAVAAGAIMPGVASSINIVFSKANSIMVKAASS